MHYFRFVNLNIFARKNFNSAFFLKNLFVMNLHPSAIKVRAIIEKNPGSTEFLKLTDDLMNDTESIEGLVELVSSDDKYPYPQYASHLLLHVSWKNHNLIEPFYEKVVDCVLTTENPSLKRNLMGVVNCFPITEYKEGDILDWLFSAIGNPASKPGLLNYSVRKLAQYIEKYPELRQEVESALELREEMDMNPGLVAWSRTVLKKKK